MGKPTISVNARFTLEEKSELDVVKAHYARLIGASLSTSELLRLLVREANARIEEGAS